MSARCLKGIGGIQMPENQITIKVGSIADLLPTIPTLLGFQPELSVVIIGLGSDARHRVEVAFRYDLPESSDQRGVNAVVDHTSDILRKQRLRTTIIVGYGPAERVTPVVDQLCAVFEVQRIQVKDALRVEDGRYWSYVCTDQTCCPPEGVPFTISPLHTAGLPIPATSRAALAASVAPTASEPKRLAAAERALGRQARLSGAEFRTAGLAAVQEAVTTYRDGRTLGIDQLTWLAIALSSLPVRDDAWARMDPEHRDAHLQLWTDVLHNVDDLFIAGAACMLAFVAWQSGQGALANVALDRALAGTPDYSLAGLLQQALDAGLPPSAARVPMTPEEVAHAYTQ
jgi:Domain of unknown function (DUF4192)